MRTLNKNKTKIWVSEPSSVVEITDIDGFKTGEYKKIYDTANIVYINIYPYNGKIVEEIFGKDYSCDMIAISSDLNFSKDALIFLSEPISDFDLTYDYRISIKNESINVFNYGLVKRT